MGECLSEIEMLKCCPRGLCKAGLTKARLQNLKDSVRDIQTTTILYISYRIL